MKFRVKITLCMLGLLSLLFGAGGSLLISASFHNALDREREAAYNSYQMVLGTLQIVNRLNRQSGYEDISRTLGQISEQNTGAWSALRLYTAEAAVYEYGSPLPQALAGPAEPGRCVIRYQSTDGGGRLLALSGTLEAGGETLYLDMTREISPLFEARQAQQQAYLWVFLFMAVLCALLSYSMARVLTAPLESLSRASRAIADGQLSSRSRVRSRDEIGLVARDFNAMAETLEANISQLEQAMARQERFMGAFAHEVKTPMTSIIGYADLIRGQTLTLEEQSEAADYIFSEGRRLESLSQKLLELLVLKRGGAALTPASPAALVQGLVRRLAPLYAAQGISLTYACGRGKCLLEPDLVKSLLLNLLDNARKALDGQGGAIHVQAELLPGGCRISVRDSGRGIPPAALEHLTEDFYRVDKARARAQGGAGLGLSLCREIAALHSGELRFDSAPGLGTTVTVILRGGAA